MPDHDRGPGYDPAAASHRALRAIRRELERHPAVDEAIGFPSHSYSRVEATLDPARLDGATGEATLTVRWFAGATADAPPEFTFHYSDDACGDFGWHHEPNPHVEGQGHFQERATSGAEYAYEPYSFPSMAPGRVVWEVLERVEERIETP